MSIKDSITEVKMVRLRQDDNFVTLELLQQRLKIALDEVSEELNNCINIEDYSIDYCRKPYKYRLHNYS